MYLIVLIFKPSCCVSVHLPSATLLALWSYRLLLQLFGLQSTQLELCMDVWKCSILCRQHTEVDTTSHQACNFDSLRMVGFWSHRKADWLEIFAKCSNLLCSLPFPLSELPTLNWVNTSSHLTFPTQASAFWIRSIRFFVESTEFAVLSAHFIRLTSGFNSFADLFCLQVK